MIKVICGIMVGILIMGYRDYSFQEFMVVNQRAVSSSVLSLMLSAVLTATYQIGKFKGARNQ